MSDENKPVDASAGAGETPIAQTAAEQTAGGAAPETAGQDQTPPQDSGTPEAGPEGTGNPAVESKGLADESTKIVDPAAASDAASAAAAQTGATTAAPETPAAVVNTPADKPPVAPVVKPRPNFPAPAKKVGQPQQQSLKSGAAAKVDDIATADATPSNGPTGIASADKHLANVDKRRHIPVLQIANYIKAMMPPKPVTEAEIIRNQKMLYISLRNIINNEVESFQHMWLAVLALFEHHKADVFHPMYVNRGVANLELTKDEAESFLRLVRLCSLTSNPQTRKQALAQFDLQAALAFELKESGRQRVTEFYSKFR